METSGVLHGCGKRGSRRFQRRDLRRLARVSRDAAQVRRLLALAVIRDGGTRTEAARIGGVGLQIVRDWVLRFYAEGPTGRPGAPAGRALAADRCNGCGRSSGCR
jgi:hypothetical protein